MGKNFKFIKILSGIFLLVFFIAGVLVLKPEWILRPVLNEFVARKITSSTGISYKALHIEIMSIAWNRKKILIQGEEVCPPPEILMGCLREIRADPILSWPYPIQLERIETLVLKSEELKVPEVVKSENAKPETKPDGSVVKLDRLFKIIEIISPEKWKELSIQLSHLDFRKEIFNIQIKSDEGDIPQVSAQIRRNNNSELKAYWRGKSINQSELNLRFSDPNQTMNVVGKSTLNAESKFNFDLNWKSLKTVQKIAAKVDLSFSKNEIETIADIEGQQIGIKWLAKINPILFHLNDDLELENIEMKSDISFLSRSYWSRLLSFKLNSNFDVADAHFSLVASNVNPAVKMDFTVECSWPEFRKGALECDLPPSLAMAVDFELLVDLLKGSPFAVFAPFHILKGPVEVKAKANEAMTQINFNSNINLKSAQQRVALVADGYISNLKQARKALNLDVVLKDGSIQLPYIEAQRPPNIGWDSRIKSKPAKVEKKTAKKDLFDLNVHFKTENPLHLQTNLAKNDVPLMVDFRMDSKSLSAIVSANPFTLQLFRRKAEVKKFVVKTVPNSKTIELQGLIEYPTSDALIQIHLSGKSSSPSVEFTSDPPLPKNEILSLLIFGRRSVNADEETTVGNTETAFSNGAFGLASLYLFASTPIESVNYNPANQSYSVRVRLPGGVSAEYGSSFGEESSQSVTLRKRLGRHWMLSTEWESFAQGSSQTVSTFLEWFTRF